MDDRRSPNFQSSSHQKLSNQSPPRISSLRTLSQVPVNLSPDYNGQMLRKNISSPNSVQKILISHPTNINAFPHMPVSYPVAIQQQISPHRDQGEAVLFMMKKQNELLEKIAGQVKKQARQEMKNENILLQEKLNRLELEKRLSQNEPISIPISSNLLDGFVRTNKKRESMIDRIHKSPLVDDRKKTQIIKDKEKKIKPALVEFIQDYNDLDQILKSKEGIENNFILQWKLIFL